MDLVYHDIEGKDEVGSALRRKRMLQCAQKLSSSCEFLATEPLDLMFLLQGSGRRQ